MTRKLALTLGACASLLLPRAQAEGEALPFVKGSETLVVIPDTEGYNGRFPNPFASMMEWVKEQREPRQIRSLLHVGDITNRNTEKEWRNARACFDLLEDKIPYVLAAGNHDYDGTEGRLSYINDFFDVAALEKSPRFGGAFEAGKVENHFQFLSLHDRPWIVLSLEMGPRKAVVEWANKVLAEHRERRAIILTHGYLYYDDERYDHHKGKQRATPFNYYGDGMDGEQLWDGLVRRHPNVMMVICGHLSSGYVGYRSDEGDYGNQVHQMMVNYEKLRGGGMGFLRLLEFLPDRETVQVRTYSPVTGETLSPATRGDKPIRPPEREEFRFKLKDATRDKPVPVKNVTVPISPLRHAPAHRYSFGGAGGHRARIDDLSGRLPATIHAPDGGVELNGKGQLVIKANKGDGFAELGAEAIEGREAASIEVWVTPSATEYNWDNVFSFGGHEGDGAWYAFRTASTHRAEICDDGRNEDIQTKGVAAPPGEPLHIVWAYDEKGADGSPRLSCYRNGELVTHLGTGIRLSELRFGKGRIGPFAGSYDELRVFAYALNPEEVAGNWHRGPDAIELDVKE